MKRSAWLVAGMLVLLVVAHSTAFARITVVLNGQVLRVSPPPVEQNGRVLIGMRDIFEAMRCDVRWVAATQTVIATKGSTEIRLQIGNHTAHVDGRAVNLDVPPQLLGDYTFVPLRFVAEATGAKVDWIAGTQTVEITGGGGGARGGGGGGGTARAPDPPVVVEPNDGQTVGPSVDVRGHAAPGVMIRIVTFVYRKATNEKVAEVPGITHRAEPDGRFDFRIAIPTSRLVEPGRAYYDIHVWAADNGVESRPTIVRVYR